MQSTYSAITTLLHRYARRLDAGDLAGVAEMFDRAEILVSGGQMGVGSAFVRQMLQDIVILYLDGTPRTRHVIAQPAITVGDDGRAYVRSRFTVLQADRRGAYVVMVGRHHDTLVADSRGWRFASRDYGDIEYVGDTSRHLRS